MNAPNPPQQKPVVMLWDPSTEAFAPRTPGPHTPSTPSSRAPFRRSNSLSSSRPISNPESILEFGEFLKQVDRERRSSGGAQHQSAEGSSALNNLASAQPSGNRDVLNTTLPPTTPSKNKLPFKAVWKEVLGGGGNNKVPPTKDVVVRDITFPESSWFLLRLILSYPMGEEALGTTSFEAGVQQT